jgi:DNA polymerase-4
VKPDRIRKSIAAERTLDRDISQETFMLEHLERIAETLEGRMKKSKVNARTITLKLKYSDFTIQTRSKTIDRFVSEKDDFLPVVKELLAQEPLKDSIRLLGISMSKLDSENPPSEELDEQLEMEF